MREFMSVAAAVCPQWRGL